MFRSLVTIAILAAMPQEIVQSARDCAVMTEHELRLACYDYLFQTATPKLNDVPADPESIIGTAVSPPPASPPPASPQDPPAAQVTISEQDFPSETAIEEKQPEQLEDKQIGTRVESITRRLRNEMVFHLANDETWTQTTNKHVTIKVGDEVYVRTLRLGGYTLTNDRGASTRVTRID